MKKQVLLTNLIILFASIGVFAQGQWNSYTWKYNTSISGIDKAYISKLKITTVADTIIFSNETESVTGVDLKSSYSTNATVLLSDLDSKSLNIKVNDSDGSATITVSCKKDKGDCFSLKGDGQSFTYRFERKSNEESLYYPSVIANQVFDNLRRLIESKNPLANTNSSRKDQVPTIRIPKVYTDNASSTANFSKSAATNNTTKKKTAIPKKNPLRVGYNVTSRKAKQTNTSKLSKSTPPAKRKKHPCENKAIRPCATAAQ